jgi:uncharacterized protein YjbJ (UPF0337 family)
VNKDQLVGSLKVALGRLNENLASVSGDPNRRSRAQQLQMEGKVQHTLGHARALIKCAIKQKISV